MKSLSIFDGANTFEDASALITEKETYTYRQLASLCAAAVPKLSAFPPKLPVAFKASNTLSSLLLIYTALATERPFVPFHAKASLEELAALQQQTAMQFIQPKEIDAWFIANADSTATAFAGLFTPNENSPACILFTSGSEGAPKGVILPHRAFLASATASEAHLGWGNDDRWLLNLPVSHVGGLSILTRCLLVGKCVVMHDGFDENKTLHAIENQGVTMTSLVPAMLDRLLAADKQNRLASLRVILLGGAAASPALRKKWCDRGLQVYETYGMTECCSQAATSPAPVTTAESHRGMKPLTGVDIQIIDEHQTILKPMQIGRIVISGPTVMQGFLGTPPVSGPLVTNDIGYVDDSHQLHVVGRADDMIITGGENVHPAEIENCLLQIEGVKATVVFGIPEATYGTQIAAALFVDENVFNAADAQRHIALSLASYKKPRQFCILGATDIPFLANGKIDRPQAIAEATPLLSQTL